MYQISYHHQLSFIHDGMRLFPGFWLTLSRVDGQLGVETLATLDSGAEVSLFDGTLANMLDIDVLAGRKQSFLSTTGTAVNAYVHRVLIGIHQVGTVELPVAFSTGPLLRNLLGRDFFYGFKIGFQERFGLINLVAEPD